MARAIPWRRRLRSLAIAHWHGELPLATSLGWCYLLPALAGALLLAWLATRIEVDGAQLRLAAAAFVLAWPALLAVDTWGLVGTWRAAGLRLGRPGPGSALAWAVRATVAAGVLLTAASAVLQQGALFWRSAQLALGRDPGGVATLAQATGQALRLNGPIGLGDGRRLAQALQARPPESRLLELSSPGGRWHDAQQLAAALQGQGWTLRVAGPCHNACALLLRAGQRRQALPEAQIGFNRAGTEQASPLVRVLARRRLAQQLAEAGLEPIFVLKALSMPSTQLWQLQPDELDRGRFISRPPRPLDLELPPAATANAPDDLAALRVHRLWMAVDKRFPGSVDEAAQRLALARQAGGGDDLLQAAAQSVLEPLLGRLLFNAEHDLREPFARLLADQIAALPDPVACRGLLQGDAAVRRTLPLPLAEREAAWLHDALIEPPRTAPPRRASGPEHEVIRRTLGGHAPAALARLRQPTAGDDRACERASRLLGEALALPAPERKLALRLAFELP